MPQRGFSLIEIIVVMAILGVLTAIGIPNVVTMINSNRSKSAAESVASGLRLARAEAIGRNAPMRFQLVNAPLSATCTYSTSSPYWVVTQTNQGSGGYDYGLLTAGGCNSAPAIPPNGVTAANCTSGTCGGLPFIAQRSPGNAFPKITVTANNPIVTFGPLGQVLNNLREDGTHSLFTPNNALTSVDFTVPSDAAAKAWRVRVNGTTGSIKFCDAALSATADLGC